MSVPQITVDHAVQLLRESFANINQPQSLVIAAIGALIMGSWGQLFVVAIGAVLVHIIIEVTSPYVLHHQPIVLPPNLMELSFWFDAVILLLGYIIVIGILFFVKRLIFRGGH